MNKISIPLRAKISENIQTIAKTISAIAVIVGAATGVAIWSTDKVAEIIDERVAGIEKTIATLELDTTRIQLLTLIQNTPEDHESIINVAWKYFQQLDGDWYMTTLFLKWANEQGVDVSNLLKGVKH